MRPRPPRRQHLRDAKVADLDEAVLRQEDVGRLQVPLKWFLMGHSRPLVRLFNTVGSKLMFNTNLADNWIRTAYLRGGIDLSDN